MSHDSALLDAVEARILGEPVELPLSAEAEDEGHDMLRRVLDSGSIDEALTSGMATPAESVDGVPLNITGIRFRQSDFDEGSGVYVLIEAFPKGFDHPVVITCGGATVIAQCVIACRTDALPFKATLRRAKKATKAGYFPWAMEPVS